MTDCGRSKSARGQGEAVSGKSQGCSCLRVFGTDRRFTSLEEAFLAYAPPPVGGQVEPSWGHRKCVEGQGRIKMIRADFALRQLIASLMQPVITRQNRRRGST